MIEAFLFLAHSWYPHECCEDDHCYPVTWMEDSKEGTKVKTEDGLQVTVPNSFHRQSSPDGQYHLCFRKNEWRLFHRLEVFCFFTPGQA